MPRSGTLLRSSSVDRHLSIESLSMSSLESLLPDLAARTVQAAGLDQAWIDRFLPHFRIQHVRLDEEDWIVIRFDYLGASSCYQYSDDQGAMERVIAEAAESFGHTLRFEREKFGELPRPRSDDTSSAEWNAEQELRQTLRSMEATADRPLRLRARPTPMRVIAVAGVGLLMLWGGIRLLRRGE